MIREAELAAQEAARLRAEKEAADAAAAKARQLEAARLKAEKDAAREKERRERREAELKAKAEREKAERDRADANAKAAREKAEADALQNATGDPSDAIAGATAPASQNESDRYIFTPNGHAGHLPRGKKGSRQGTPVSVTSDSGAMVHLGDSPTAFEVDGSLRDSRRTVAWLKLRMVSHMFLGKDGSMQHAGNDRT